MNKNNFFYRIAGFILLFLLMNVGLQAQGIYLAWDKYVGCRIVSEDEQNHENILFLEEIDNNNCLRVCAGSNVYYTLGDPENAITSTQWEAAGGWVSSSNAHNASIQWGSEGDAMLTVRIVKTDGTQSTYQICISVIPVPAIEIKVVGGEGQNHFCMDNPINFDAVILNTGGSNIVSYFWDFGDDNYSSEKSPTHTYSKEYCDMMGYAYNFHVILTVTNECNCQTLTDVVIYTLPAERVEIVCPTVSCDGSIETYSVPSADCPVQWEVEHGTIITEYDTQHHNDYQPTIQPKGSTNPPEPPAKEDPPPVVINNYNSITVQWDDVEKTGYGVVRALADCSPCPEWQSVRVPLVNAIGKISGSDKICVNQQATYTLPQWATTDYKWSIKDLDDPAFLIITPQRNEIIVQRLGPGIYTLRCDYTNTLKGCSGFAEKEITVLDRPYISGISKICEGVSVELHANSSYTPPPPFNWTVKGNNYTKYITTQINTLTLENLSAGDYLITVSNEQWCSPYSAFVLTVKPRPKVHGITITGDKQICFEQPYIYSIPAEAVPKGYTVEWTLTNGSYVGMDDGVNTAVVKFTRNLSNPVYNIQAVIKLEEEPYCASDPVTLTVYQKTGNTTITTAGNSFNFCPSSTHSFTAANLPADYEAIEWVISPSDFGSVGTGKYSKNVDITWHEIKDGISTGQLILRVKLCGEFSNIVQTINLNEKPNLAWDNSDPVTVCAGESYTFTVKSDMPIAGGATVDWKINGTTVSTNTYPSNTYSLSNTINQFVNKTNEPLNVKVTAAVRSSMWCNTDIILTQDITVLPSPLINIYNKSGLNSFCDASEINTTLEATYQNNLTVSTISWYKSGNPNVLQTGGQQFTVTSNDGFGDYYAKAVSDNGCTTQSKTVKISQKDCTTPSEAEVNECINKPTVSAVQTDCRQITLSTSNCGSSGSGWVYSTDINNFTNIVTNGCNQTLEPKHPGIYSFAYHYVDNAQNCISDVPVSQSVIIPYLAKLEYTVSCAGNGYNVTLKDNSEKMPDYVPWVKFYIDGILAGQNAVSITQFLQSGTHTLKLETGINGFFICTDQKQITLAPIPDAQFILNTTAYCPENALIPQLTTAPQAGCTYKWEVLDANTNKVKSTNFLLQPNLMPGEPRDYMVKLTLTNANGCLVSSTSPKFTVYSNEMKGDVTGTSVICKGTNTPLSFAEDPNSPIHPTEYQWMDGTTALTGFTKNSSYNADKSGSYWVVLKSDKGCVNKDMTHFNLFAISPPQPTIDAPDAVCYGSGVTLNGKLHIAAGQEAQYQYRWLRNGVQYTSLLSATNNTNLTISDNPTTATTYTLELQGGQANCKTVSTHTVKVNPVPATPALICWIVNDNPYTVEIRVLNTEPNMNYLWSNGMSGTVIQVFYGGPYQVTARGQNDCSAQAQITIPHDPAEYLWIFPSGCYQVCQEEMINLLGPSSAARFAYYSWIKDWSSDKDGFDPWGNNLSVPDYQARGADRYSLLLENFDCVWNGITRESAPLNVSRIQCQICDFQYSIITEEWVYDPYIYINGTFTVFNPYPFDILVTASVGYNEGVLITQNFMVAAGYSASMPFIFIPNLMNNNTVMLFASNDFEFTVIAESVHEWDDFHCTGKCRRNGSNYYPDNYAPKPLEQTEPEQTGISMTVMPNPSDRDFTLHYQADKTVLPAQAIVYDVSGKLLWSSAITQSQGDFNISAVNWAAGNYIAVMKKDGKILKQQVILKK